MLLALVVLLSVAPQAPVPGVPVPSAPGVNSAASAMAKAEQEVQKAESDRFEAMTKADGSALDHLLAPELIYTHSNGQVQDKIGFVADIRNKLIRYISIEPSDMRVVLLGTTAIVVGSAALHTIQNGNELNIRIRYTAVHMNRRGEWELVAWQATRE